jgi:glycosyltransferase involved in cell wall biosynthesis
MLNSQKIVVVLPAYNAEATLEATYRDLPFGIVDDVILVDDASGDRTVETARRLGITTIVHDRNRGYGANQKTCYREALARGADVVVMVHPDYQYDPRLVTALCAMIVHGPYDYAIASRILGGRALQGGMPPWKYVCNRALTFVQNLLMGQKVSEYHTGYRAYSRRVLEAVPFHANSDDFVFDNEMLAQLAMQGFRVGEISCPTSYFPAASSIDFRRSVTYGLGCLSIALRYRLHRAGLVQSRLFGSVESPVHEPAFAKT